MSDGEILEFDGELIMINIVLDKASLDEIRDTWRNRVRLVQPPLVETYKSGMHVTIPWVLKDE